MDASGYRKEVVKLLPTSEAKRGLRVVSGNKRMLNISRSMVGTVSAISLVLTSTDRFILGYQMDDSIRAQFRSALGELLFWSFAGAKELKVKMPATTKKVRPKATMTELLMQLNSIGTDLLKLYLQTYRAHGLAHGMEEVPRTAEEMKLATDAAKARAHAQGKKEFPTPKSTKKVESQHRKDFLLLVKNRWEAMVPILYELSWSILNEPVATVLDADLSARGVPTKA
jgi:hypothetical protein